MIKELYNGQIPASMVDFKAPFRMNELKIVGSEAKPKENDLLMPP